MNFYQQIDAIIAELEKAKDLKRKDEDTEIILSDALHLLDDLLYGEL